VCKTEINFVKYLSDLSSKSLFVADKRGFIQRIILGKKLLGISCKSEKIIESPISDICTIAALQPKEGMPYEVIEWAELNITAISSTENITIYCLSDPIESIYSIRRSEFSKNFIREGSLCYLDWGYGITPNISRERSRWLLAIGWDKVLQIVILDDPYQRSDRFIYDGYYVWDYPIDCVQFISDSVIMILYKKKEVRILFIPSFMPGSFMEQGTTIKEIEDKKGVTFVQGSKSLFQVSLGEDLLRDLSLKAEVETGKNFLDGNIRYTETWEKQNFTHSIVASENNIIILGHNELLLCNLYHWEDYLEYIRKNCGWLIWLKAALDIYNGNLKGYYGVPYISDNRKADLINKLKEFVFEGIRDMISLFYGNRKLSEVNEGSADLKRDDNAINVAIEFWYEINTLDFLFTIIFNEFQKEGFEDKFVENLEPFILSGYFKDELLPNKVLKKIWDYYFEHRKYHVLERIVSCLNFSCYDLLDELMAVCSMKKLTTTMIHLVITSNQSGDDSCKKVLDGVFECFHSNKKHFTLDDIKYFIHKTKEEKYDIASSYEYIGLKLMHILRLFIKGERFPEGKLRKDKHVLYLTQSISFITENDKVFELIQVNARSFFTVITEIFLNKHVASMLIELNINKDTSRNLVFGVTHQKIIERFSDIVDALQNVDYIKYEYYYFIIKIALADCFKLYPQRLASKVYDSISYILDDTQAYIEQKKAFSNYKVPLSQKYIGPNETNLTDLEQEILDILPFYTPHMNGDQLGKIIESSKALKIDRLRIHIYEEQKNYEECIHTYLRSEGCKTEDVFLWLKLLQRKHDLLDEDSTRRIKNEILKVIDELVMADSVRTSEVIDTWLPNQQLEIIDKLGSNKDLQLKYLKDFVSEREDEIKEAMLSTGGKRNQTRDQINDYKYFLKLHVKLLASKESSELKNVVMKEYYPVDCLDDINDNSTNFKEAQAYLCKRSGDIEKSLSIFLDLIEEIGYDEIKNDSLYQNYVSQF
jgi:hypothetical protein